MPANEVNDRISAWKSASIDDVIKYWGIPSKKLTVNGQHYAEWTTKNNNSSSTAISLGTGSYSRGGSIGLGLTLFDIGNSEDFCQRIVTYSKQGKITDIRWKGDRDFCYEITPQKN